MRRAAKLPKDWFYCLNCAKPAKTNELRQPGSQKFCTSQCRKEFWKHGGVSVHRLRLSVQGWIREYLAANLPAAILTALEADGQAIVKTAIQIRRRELGIDAGIIGPDAREPGKPWGAKKS